MNGKNNTRTKKGKRIEIDCLRTVLHVGDT